MLDYKIETINIIVNCPREPHLLSKYKIQMRGVIYNDGRSFFDNNCCDMMSGAIECQKCRLALSVMFTNGYRPQDDKPVTPDFSIFRSRNE